MISVKVGIDTRPLDEIGAGVRTLKPRFRAKLQRRMPSVRTKVLAITAVEPGPPSYPITTRMTLRQRRAFWATNGFGAGIPTQRTGAILEAYEVTLEISPAGGQIILDNPHPAADYVVGEHQQDFHADTGYIQIDSVQAQNEEIALEAVVMSWDDTVLEALE